MEKQKVRFHQGFRISLRGFVSWYVMSAGIYILLACLMEGSGWPLLVAVFALILLFVDIPIGIVVGIVVLFNSRHSFAFGHWFALGVLAAYFINVIASYLFPPFLSAYLVEMGLYTSSIPRDLTSPNGGLAGYMGLPFFMR